METGHTLGHYRLIEKLGEGGMGVVWRAMDTTLDREVAVKILPESFEQHPDRLDRFEREAKVLAQLHHPNIAVLHGLHKHEDRRFLVMELVDGEDLSQRLSRGPLPTVDALKLCAQVARALQAAHDRNVVHRDLKPANIVLTASGEAKVLDFGLAKIVEPEAPAETEYTSAPTVTTGGTLVGTILGTAAYMSPEQARGKPTDRRTDIWSFGCVLYECLTGVSEFRGDTMSDSIGAILHKSPDWEVLPDDLPVTVRWLLRRCLTKDRDNRLHDIADARIELEQAIVDPQAAGLPLPATADTGSRRPWLWPVVAVALAALASVTAWWLKPAAEDHRSAVSLSIQLPTPQEWPDFTMAPDGTALVYQTMDERAGVDDTPTARLWLRRMDAFVPTPIPGTEKASRPVFSPDGTMVAYLVKRESGGEHQADLRVVGLDGRPPLTLATNATDHSPPVWLSAGEIVYVDHEAEKRLLAVSRGGGDPRIYAELGPDAAFTSFDFGLAGERGWIVSGTFADALPVVTLIDPATAEEFRLLQDARGTRILDDGKMPFIRRNVLLLAQVDLDATPPKLVGDVKTVMGTGTDPTDRIGRVEVSEAGHLAFVTGAGPNESRQLMTVDRDGEVETLVEATSSYAVPVAFSTDGKLLSVLANDFETPAELWIVELDTGARRPMAPKEQVAYGGCWVPNGRIVFTAWKSVEQGRIMIRELRRNAEPEPLFDNWPENLRLRDGRVSFDGTNVAFEVIDRDHGDADIWIQPLDGSSEPRPLVATRATETFPSFSVDGRVLAYTSNESGRREVYVRNHSAGATSESSIVKVSRSGGDQPLWSPDGNELFFFDWPNERMMGVRIESDDPLRLSEPYEVIPDLPALRPSRHWEQPEFIPMPDGKRFVFVQSPEAETKVERIDVVLNWAELLER